MLTASEEVQNLNVGAAERRRELDDWVGRLHESMALFTAQLEQFRTRLNQAKAPQEGLAAPVLMKALNVFTPDLDEDAARAARDTIQQVLANIPVDVVEESTRVGIQHDDNMRRVETRDGLDPEA